MFSGWGARLIAVGVFLGGIVLAIRKAVSTGRRLEQADQMEETLEKGRKHRARKSNIGRLSSDKLAKRLRRWERRK